MTRLIKIAALTLCALMLCSLLAACGTTPDVDYIKKTGKLVMLTSAGFPPFEYVEGGQVVGVDVDIANEIAKDLGVSLEVQDMEFAGIVGAIKSGKGSLGIAGMSITEERKQSVDFSIQYVNSKLFILVAAGNDAINTPDDLKGKIIGVQTGTTSDIFASDVENATINRYSQFLEAATALTAGKVDAMVVDELTANEIMAANEGKMKMLETPLAEEAYAIAVQKGNTTLLEAVNKTLQRLIDEGKIEEYIYSHSAGSDAAE